MDWAIKAAKKKTQVPPGSTRSIIESLNAFNNVILTDQTEINSVLSKEREWLNNNFGILSSSFENSKHSVSLISPDKTMSLDGSKKTTNDVNINRSLSYLPRETLSKSETTRNGEYIASTGSELFLEKQTNTQHITPESTNTVNILDLQVSNITKQENTKSIAAQNNENLKEKSSPWSPYKVNQILKDPNANSLQLLEKSSISPNAAQTFTESKTLNEISEPLSKNSSAINNSITNSFASIESLKSKQVENKRLKDFVKRRSNMFVPLPDKDPLVVQPYQSIPANRSSSNLNTGSNTNKRTSLLLTSISTEKLDKEAKLNQTSTVAQLSHKKKPNSLRFTQSPIRKQSPTSQTCLNQKKNSTPNKSVFDRLANLPTKSFENKMLTKNNKQSASAIDLKGSPIRRKSFQPNKRETIDRTMEQALKNIFSTKEEIAIKKGQPHNTVTRRSLIPKHNRYESTTILSRSALKPASNKYDNQDRSPQVSPSRAENRPRMVKNHISPSSIQSKSLRNNSLVTKKSSISPMRSKLMKPSMSPLKPTGRLIPTNSSIAKTFSKSTDAKETQSSNKIEIMKKTDRLTGFKLLSSIESNNNSRKGKSNINNKSIRLSYYKEHEIQNKYEESKHLAIQTIGHKTRQSTSNHNRDQLINNKSNQIGNSILHDLNTKDYRTKVGASSKYSPKAASTNPDQSLPEILSDSETEDNKILATWADGPQLQEQLKIQETWNTHQLFGPFPPLYMDEIFHNSRLNKLKSGQSLSNKN